MSTQECDVFISGAGPVGLILAFHLNRLGHSVYIIDSVDKGSPDHPMYGRATFLYPRSIEILDQMDLCDEIGQIGFISDRSWGYKNGEHIDRKWGFFDAPESRMDTTFFNTTMNIRLKFIEDVFRKRLTDNGILLHTPAKLVDLQVNEGATDGLPIEALYMRSNDSADTVRVKSKYIIGCDGAGSAVRRLADIPFPGEKRKEYWVRIDGVLKTNIPEARFGLGAIESSTHGHVLYVALDHGTTRIGYVLSDELFQKYGHEMTPQQAAYEAQRAVAPFEIEFTQIDWHTVYGIQQHLADRFQDRQRILIAGDAAHTHSSSSAQGMNAGIQDAASLSWRLAGILKGWYRPEVLENYSQERRGIAWQLIENDKIISTLVAQRKPESLQHRSEHPHVLLDEFFRTNSGFSTGLGVEYGPSFLNDVDASSPMIGIRPGQRVPDALLQRPGLAVPKVRLYDMAKNNGKFRIIVFTGDHDKTASSLKALKSKVDACRPDIAHAVEFLTIVPGFWHVFEEHLGIEPFGMGYWDPDMSAHGRLGVSVTEGAILVMRPDGMLGLVSPLSGFSTVIGYFKRILYT